MSSINSAVATVATTHWARDVAALAKPRLSTTVLFTAGIGLWLAPGQIGWIRGALTLLATAALVGAANALNCFLERKSDGLMHRTQTRPLPAGRLEPKVAAWFGGLVGLTSLPAIAVTSNLLTAMLGALAFFSYVAIYTPLKKRSTWALVVGAVPGALPPLMGYTAVTGHIDAMGAALFAFMFFWQLPHFLAISFYLQQDYGRGGLRTFANVYGRGVTKAAIIASTAVLVPVSYVPFFIERASMGYVIAAAMSGTIFFGWSITGLLPNKSTRWARGFFLGSLLYLLAVMGALLIDSML